MRVYWSLEAVDDFEKNIQYLENTFSLKELQQFISKTEDVIHKISNNPKLFQKTNYRNIHSVPIVSAIRLFYRIQSKNEIELVRFWNNHQNPEYLTFKQ